MLGKVEVQYMPEQMGQYMRIELEKQLEAHQSTTKEYKLFITLSRNRAGAFLSAKGFSSRQAIVNTASCKIVDKKGKVLLEKAISARNSFFVVESSPLSIFAVEQKAEEANIDRLVNDIISNLYFFFSQDRFALDRDDVKAS